MKELLKYYKGYLKRNKTLEEFISDVNTLGGTFNNGFIDTKKGVVTIQDKNFKVIKKVKLKEIWEEYIGSK